ncbi:hypothetical protein [Gordonia tangerina]|uniref:Lipoprotein n=1 Tax=Gordonia tangerina TaxID=2911060 RepID=A0ABS9DCR6_9ACTN|nr:hypothetical protein [Gordonia tangerina]MCF3936981.1 hypothetical protein [Gordonia tangerina]
MMTSTVLIATLMAIVAGTTACGTASDASSEDEDSSITASRENWSPIANVHVDWTSEGGEALTTSDATFIRATFEADVISALTGDEAEAFPGFSTSMRDPDARRLYETGGGLLKRYEYDYWTAISRIENRAGDAVNARVCFWYTERAQGSPLPSVTDGADMTGPGVRVIDYQRTGESPPDNQRGPNASPNSDVFGDWYVSSIQRTWADGDPNKPVPSKECPEMSPPRALKRSSPGWPTQYGE